jgi:hypothetical protein
MINESQDNSGAHRQIKFQCKEKQDKTRQDKTRQESMASDTF